MKFHALPVAVATLISGLTTGCNNSPFSMMKGPSRNEIDLVRDGFLTVQFGSGAVKTYDSLTVGKALEGTFKNSKWKYFTTQKGAGVVEFDATESDLELKHDHIATTGAQCVEGTDPSVIHAYDPHCQVSIRFQFVVSADRKSFSLAYISLTDANLNVGDDRPTDAQVLAYIYR